MSTHKTTPPFNVMPPPDGQRRHHRALFVSAYHGQPDYEAVWLATCDWGDGDCDDRTVAIARTDEHGWLPVCGRHANEARAADHDVRTIHKVTD